VGAETRDVGHVFGTAPPLLAGGCGGSPRKSKSGRIFRRGASG
jgi:hypothetical protein